VKRFEFHFYGIDWIQHGGAYQFTSEFEEWWDEELGKRLGDETKFIEKHGEGWCLQFSFRARKNTKTIKVVGPDIWRNKEADPPRFRRWCIALPFFEFRSPEPKAYVPLMRQFLDQLVIVLERDGIDASKIKKDSPLLLKRFAAQPGMLEAPDFDFRDSTARRVYARAVKAEKKARGRAKVSAKSLKTQKAIQSRLKNLRRKYALKFGVVFDATGRQRRSKGWLADYAVVDLTVVLPSKKAVIPDDLYAEAIEIFRHAEKTLKRSRTFFCLRIVPALNKPKWSVALLLRDRDFANTHSLIREAAGEFLGLRIGNAEFKKQYTSNEAHLLCAYSHRDKCLRCVSTGEPITFSDYYDDSEEAEQSLLSDKCGDDIVCLTGVHLGNLNYFLKRDREAIPHWQRAANTGQPEALMCIGGAYARLGDLEKTLLFCKRAIENGVSRKMLDDPDFAPFRRHPRFLKLKSVGKKKPTPPAVSLSPKWSMPKNLKQLVQENDGMRDDERWNPVLLTVMSDTSSRGRKIPLTWQLQFDPYVKPFKAAGKKQIETRGVEPDGDAWTNLVEREFAIRYPELMREFDSDSESSTCVVSVKSEGACEKLMELIWSLIYPK